MKAWNTQVFEWNTRICVVFLRSGVVALIEAAAQLQVVEPHLQKCIDVACCTQIGQADKSVLEERERGRMSLWTSKREGHRQSLQDQHFSESKWERNCPVSDRYTLSRRSEFGSSILWKLFSSISPSHTCSPMATRQFGFPLQFLLPVLITGGADLQDSVISGWPVLHTCTLTGRLYNM